MKNSTDVISIDACPTCHCRRHEPLPTPGRWIGREVFERQRDRIGLARCTNCGLVFVNPRPAEPLLAEFYGGRTYECHRPNDAGWVRDKANVLLGRVRQHVPRAQRLLDYGCGGGFLLRQALRSGFDAIGLDIGTEARRTCAEQGFRVVADPSELAPGSFDAIVMHHVFEHVPDPRRTLAALQPLLSERGKVLIEVPNVASLRARLSLPWPSQYLGVDERYRAFPIHLWYFEPRTLRRLLDDAGFRVTALETYGIGLDELFFREEESSEPSAPKDSRPARGVVSDAVRGWVKRALYDASLGENLLAIGVARNCALM
jgi:2-polyprenyl-3-methyl-5-hydroxy-6-metoxy-1,4-benzoquinol methylase